MGAALNKQDQTITSGQPARPTFSAATQQRLGLFITLLLAGVATAAMVIYLGLAFNWRSQPFIGAMLTHTLVVDGSQPTETGTWPALKAGLHRLDQITAINEQPLFTIPGDYATAYENYRQIRSEFKHDRVVTLEFIRPVTNGILNTTRSIDCDDVVDGRATCTLAIPLREYPNTDFVASFIIPYVSALIVLVMGLVLLRFRMHQPLALLVSATCFVQSIFLAGLFDINTSHILTPLWLVATTLMGVVFVLLALNFPVRARVLYLQPVLQYLPVVAGAVICALVIYFYLTPPSGEFPIFNTYIASFSSIFGLIALTFVLVRRRARALTALVRDQTNITLIGIALASVPILLWIGNIVTRPLLGIELVTFNINTSTPFFILPALSMVYAVFQYRWTDTDRVVSQTITYGIMMLALVLGYFLLVLGVSLITGRFIAANDAAMMALAIFAIAVLFLPVRTRLQQRIDEIYFRARRNYQSQNEQFAEKLTTMVEFDDIVKEYRAQLESAVKPSQTFIFLPNRQTGEFVAVGGNTDVRFAANSPLISLLTTQEEVIYLEAGRPWPKELVVERARLMILKALVMIALRGGNKLNGFVVIGPPLSGSGEYTFEALRFVQNLTRQISVAVERAQVVESLERRVRELDVLSQVSQAMNFTADFDDLLELISTQSDRLIEATHFYIALRDQTANELYFAFFLENYDRYPEKENKRWVIGRDLYSEIVRNSQAVRTPNYVKTMAERGIDVRQVDPDEDPELKAWMGVPLIAGSNTMGVLAAGSTKPSKVYTDEQYKIFMDIAALAATSLDKARLFTETNTRARQLAVLNDISRQLVAVESDLEQLLLLITSNAVEILNAEAGSLLLTVDDNSNDLEFKVVTGGSGSDLVGKRIPSNRGLVGEVATKGEYIIVNNAASDPRWGGELSKGSFKTNSVLAVPLITQNRVIGVLEILNKKAGDLFITEDADLLTTFAGQAAVAIENARLFQMTDLQLTERVSELEMMERIDVELNRSLELSRVAEITVTYAVKNSGASAGLLGIVIPDSNRMAIAAIEGYTPEDYPEGVEGDTWPLDVGIVSRVMRTKSPDLSTDVSIDPNYKSSLRGAKSQITIPMLSGGSINAILILESAKERFGLVQMAFVQRLAEHASIAIANAQLYAELNRANQSKSEFVSFVAHELKNPLASITGYSKLLTSGMVGALSDQQKDFLDTIGRNADRMNTLVSDLNDVTKLQTDNMRIEISPVDFRIIVTETLRPLQKLIEGKDQELIVDVPENLPQIAADQNRMIQVMTNMVSNAHKYSPPGGTITIQAVILEATRDAKGKPIGPMLRASVADTGIGMSKEDLARLFTPYFRSENPLTREQPGTGLGLTITQGLIRRHGGDVWVESELGKGTTFFFTIPLVKEEQVAK